MNLRGASDEDIERVTAALRAQCKLRQTDFIPSRRARCLAWTIVLTAALTCILIYEGITWLI